MKKSDLQSYATIAEQIRINILLYPKDRLKLDKIKELTNIKHDAVAVRALINSGYDDLIGSKVQDD
jgi:hypothetical protein